MTNNRRSYTIKRGATKSCNVCLETKPIESFAYQSRKEGYLQSYCRECSAQQTKKVYTRHKRRIAAYLACHPCVDCGNDNPIVLEFDHVKGTKSFSISNAWARKWVRVVAEIEKCEIRCRNCHAIRHHEAGTARYNGLKSVDPEKYYDYEED